jgi:TrmH family RNA methyltransferase
VSASERTRFERRTPQDPLTRLDQTFAFVGEDAWRPPEWFGHVAVVLVEPTDAVNIGGVVRVMANTGFLRLRLVNPVQFDARNVIGVAHYTQHILERIETYTSLEAAVVDATFVVGVTGRHSRVERNALGMPAAIDEIVRTAAADGQVAVVFGREDRGLSNAMLDVCHSVTTIPTNPAYPSLNLAQAALLVLYALFSRADGQEQRYRPHRKATPAASSDLLEDLFADLERALDAIEFLTLRSRASVMRSLRVALFRARLDMREAALLRAIVLEVRHFLRRRGVIDEFGAAGRKR